MRNPFRYWSVGIHRRSKCWRFRFMVMRFNTCTHYVFWRLWLSIPTRHCR